MYSRSSWVIKLVSIFLSSNIFSALKNMSDSEASLKDEEPLEAPKVKKPRSEKQQETVKLARAKKSELDQKRLEEKERLKAEARFDQLLSLFDKIRLDEPKPSKRPTSVPKQPEEPELELEKPKVKAVANPASKEVFLRFY
jgi:hypothetical protein